MNILFFGIGQFYRKRKSVWENICSGDEVLGFVDNRAKEIGMFEGKPVYLPAEILSISFDAVILMSVSVIEMREQLLSIGVPSEKIYYWGQYVEQFIAQTQQWLPKLHETHCTPKGRILIVSSGLSIGGGILASCYAAELLVERGYEVTLAAPSGDESFLARLREAGVNAWILPGLPFLQWNRVETMHSFDAAIVCFFQNMHVAYELSLRMPTIWWVHELRAVYHPFYRVTRYCFPALDTPAWMGRLRIVAVSKMAQQNFEDYYPHQTNGVLALGEPDTASTHPGWKAHLPVRFAVLGAVIENKGQDLFLQAALRMPKDLRESSEFFIVGAGSKGSSIYQRCQKILLKLPQAHNLGWQPPEMVAALLPTIDVIVCASLEETMSMPIIEGMMHGKICITTDMTGVAAYIDNGQNGFVVKAGDVDALAHCMMEVHQHMGELQSMREAARKTYEQNFTMEAFGNRLEAELHAAMMTKMRR